MCKNIAGIAENMQMRIISNTPALYSNRGYRQRKSVDTWRLTAF